MNKLSRKRRAGLEGEGSYGGKGEVGSGLGAEGRARYRGAMRPQASRAGGAVLRVDNGFCNLLEGPPSGPWGVGTSENVEDRVGKVTRVRTAGWKGVSVEDSKVKAVPSGSSL